MVMVVGMVVMVVVSGGGDGGGGGGCGDGCGGGGGLADKHSNLGLACRRQPSTRLTTGSVLCQTTTLRPCTEMMMRIMIMMIVIILVMMIIKIMTRGRIKIIIVVFHTLITECNTDVGRSQSDGKLSVL